MRRWDLIGQDYKSLVLIGWLVVLATTVSARADDKGNIAFSAVWLSVLQIRKGNRDDLGIISHIYP